MNVVPPLTVYLVTRLLALVVEDVVLLVVMPDIDDEIDELEVGEALTRPAVPDVELLGGEYEFEGPGTADGLTPLYPLLEDPVLDEDGLMLWPPPPPPAYELVV